VERKRGDTTNMTDRSAVQRRRRGEPEGESLGFMKTFGGDKIEILRAL